MTKQREELHLPLVLSLPFSRPENKTMHLSYTEVIIADGASLQKKKICGACRIITLIDLCEKFLKLNMSNIIKWSKKTGNSYSLFALIMYNGIPIFIHRQQFISAATESS
jgi:hypothetical protein